MNYSIVIFGASGDLTSRKLVPALYELFRKRRLPGGNADRRLLPHAVCPRRLAGETGRIDRQVRRRQLRPRDLGGVCPQLFYHPGDIGRPEDFRKLGEFLGELGGTGRRDPGVLPGHRAAVLRAGHRGSSGAAGLAEESRGPRRIVIEKPFGIDLASARQLNEAVHEVFAEEQVYRIDHYLGKETVQNILVFRFANAIFEPIWNRNYVDHVRDHGGRGADRRPPRRLLRPGRRAARHVPEPPAPAADAHGDGGPGPVRGRGRPRREGQGAAGHAADAARRRGQRQRSAANTGAIAASRAWPPTARRPRSRRCGCSVDNWRWQGVPFYLRSGKAMSCPTTQIIIQFRQPPLHAL